MNNLDEINAYRYTKLNSHVQDGDYENVKLMIEQGVKLDIKQVNKYESPLTISIMRQFTDLSLLLIKYGANVNFQNYHGLTPLIMAIQYKQVKVALAIINTKSVDINMQDSANYTALIWAAVESWKEKEDCISIVTALINKKVNIELRDKYGLTALMNAAQNNNIEIVKLLADNGADVNAQDYKNGTALTTAAYNGHYNVVDFLIKAGAKLDIQDNEQSTALMYA